MLNSEDTKDILKCLIDGECFQSNFVPIVSHLVQVTSLKFLNFRCL